MITRVDRSSCRLVGSGRVEHDWLEGADNFRAEGRAMAAGDSGASPAASWAALNGVGG